MVSWRLQFSVDGSFFLEDDNGERITEVDYGNGHRLGAGEPTGRSPSAAPTRNWADAHKDGEDAWSSWALYPVGRSSLPCAQLVPQLHTSPPPPQTNHHHHRHHHITTTRCVRAPRAGGRAVAVRHPRRPSPPTATRLLTRGSTRGCSVPYSR